MSSPPEGSTPRPRRSDAVELPDAEGPGPAPRRAAVSRRAVLAGGAALAATGVAAGWWVSRGPVDQDPSASASASASPSQAPLDSPNVSDPQGPDETAELQAMLDEGSERVVVPPGTHVISATLVVPWHVRTLELPEGSVLHMRGDEIALRRSGEVSAQLRTVTRAVEGEAEVTLDASGLAPGGWLYLCADDWVKVDKSKVGMLRRIESVEGDVVVVDKPLVRTLQDGPRAHAVELAPAFSLVGGGAVENGSPTSTRSNLVRFDLVEGIEVTGVELRDCGTAALRTFATVGGTIDCWIHDCVDNPSGRRYGYGVSCTSATRDLTVRGRIERVRHAFTTDHGYDAPLPSLQLTGEPEDIFVAPVVRDTTSTGIDTHEPGHGITIVPDVENCGTQRWGGVNVRARNVTIEGGSVRDSNEWGILVSPSAVGTVIRDVEVLGVRNGRGVDCRTGTTLEGGSISGFGSSFGLHVREGATVSMAGTVIDGAEVPKSRGIALAGQDCTLEGTIRACDVGLLRLPPETANVVDLAFDNVGRAEVTAGG